VFAGKHGDKIDPNQEFVAIGMANIAAGLLTGFPAATSSSRTAVCDQMGGKSQRVGLLDLAAFRFLRRVRAAEFWLAVTTTLGVLTVGILQGILVAVVLSLINVLYHISRPHDALLDDVDASGGTVYRGVAHKETALTEPGMIVYRFDAPLVFANAGYFSERIHALVDAGGDGLHCVVLDAEAISDFDATAAETLEGLAGDLERLGVELWIARANSPLRNLLEVTGLMAEIGVANIYPSVRAAVAAYRGSVTAADFAQTEPAPAPSPV
jgi:sulfate permease, SulP family